MVHFDYVCDACGFTSQEERGVYNCPVCGNQMRIAKGGYSGDNSAGFSKLLIYVLECIFILPICLVFLNVFGVILFIILLLLTRRWLNNRFKDKAIKALPNAEIRNPDKMYVCHNCGGNFNGQRPVCPHCGMKLGYED